MADLIGQHISNYEIIGVLGKGGMAVVYRARQLNIQREVAIKVIKPDLAETDDLIRRFEREAKTVASLSHPHILKLFDFGQFEGMLYLVMELMHGGTLADTIRTTPLSPERAVRLLDQIADALDYSHAQGLIHRDLKPQNILLDRQGNAHLTDFGIAKILTENTVFTQTGVAIGTPAYMPPEQWHGEALDARADVYALGVMLYEMLTGKLPFTGETPASLMYRHLQDRPPSIHTAQSGLPRDVDRVIQTALAKAPGDRFASAGDMAQAFRQAIEADEVDHDAESDVATVFGSADQPQTSPAQAKRAKSRAVRPVIIGSLLLVVLVGGVLITRFQSGAVPTTATVAVTQPATQAVVAVASTTASPTPMPTQSPIPPASVPTQTRAPATPTAVPTHDTTAVAQGTNTAAAFINAARTQLFVEDQTGTAAQWTATPSETATFMPSPTVLSPTPSITFTPSPTYTPTLAPTPSIPVWDEFRSGVANATLWEKDAWGNRWVATSARIRAMAVLVTLEKKGAIFRIAFNGTANFVVASYSIAIDCTYLDIGRGPSSVYQKIITKPFHVVGCPATRLIYISIEDKRAHFYLDGEEVASADMKGDATALGISVDNHPITSAVFVVHKVWIKFAP